MQSPQPRTNLVPLSGVELQAARQAATERFLAIAEKLKKEAGVTKHTIRQSLDGFALANGNIVAPEGRTRKQLYILAHECGHIVLGHFGRKMTRHREEMEAEKWAHNALRRHGVPVPRAMTKSAKKYVARKINQAKKRGAKKIDAEAKAYAAGFVSKPATVRFEGRCPGGVRRVWTEAEADNAFRAALECIDAVKDYVRRRPDTGPAEKWELYKTKSGQHPDIKVFSLAKSGQHSDIKKVASLLGLK